MSLNILYIQMVVSDLFMYTNLLTLNKGVHQMHFVVLFFFSSSEEGSAVSWKFKTFIVFFLSGVCLCFLCYSWFSFNTGTL